MKNKITDLRNHLFEQLERINNDKLTAEELQSEIQRANAMSELGKVIVDSAKVQVLAMKIVGGRGDIKTITEHAKEFTEADTETTPIVRPAAKYSNKTQNDRINELLNSEQNVQVSDTTKAD